jgi:glutamate N-acetyltransferase/amino-acid N-acetyltransferase
VSVTFARGFRAAGVVAGLKPSGRPDLALLVADQPCPAAAVFTTNAFPAAPVTLSRSRLANGRARAILVNSGQANAGTGEAGATDAEQSTGAAAAALGVDPAFVLAASTGVIGERLPMRPLLDGLGPLVASLSDEGGSAFAEAIMTTDTVTKTATAGRRHWRTGGCAKGVGMIAPNLATMLAFVTTDASVSPASARTLVTGVLEPVFESLTVDASPSTNDSVFLLASGAAGGAEVEPGSDGWADLASTLEDVGTSLVEQLAADAEGGTHVLVVEVAGAASEEDARRVARAIADSPLVKTAVFGGDPNPGRILQAIGAAGVTIDPGAVAASIGGVPVIESGRIDPRYFAGGAEAARAAMKERTVVIAASVGAGPGRGRMIGCDLSYDYVRINGEYTT